MVKLITRVALALFVGALIIHEPEEIAKVLGTTIEVFGKELAKLEARKKK